MKPVSAFRKAFGVDSSGTAVSVASLLVACLTLARGDWQITLIFLSGSAIFGAIVWGEMTPDSRRSERGCRIITRAAGLVPILVACLSAIEGDFVFAAGLGLVIVGAGIAAVLSRMRVRRTENSR